MGCDRLLKEKKNEFNKTGHLFISDDQPINQSINQSVNQSRNK